MRRFPTLAWCMPAVMLASGCITRTIEVRPVAPVVEAGSFPVNASAPASARLSGAGAASGSSGTAGSGSSGLPQEVRAASEAGTPPGVQVEAVIPGVYTGRSLSFERDERSRQPPDAGPGMQSSQ